MVFHQNTCRNIVHYSRIKQQNVISQYWCKYYVWRWVIISCLRLIRYASTKLARGQGDVRRNVQTLRRHHVVQRFPGISKRIGISIFKPRNYLDYVTWKGKKATGSWCFGYDSVTNQSDVTIAYKRFLQCMGLFVWHMRYCLALT